ncbi:LysM peptidoglycan-binding domain-containing protein [Streptomyces sp. MA15]|uniref:LysM peptidoglycan-binding domain-containing protein n=1 Tax=Streptomyces sp. MA15 TaxID=3055061 RepID=UPI0025B1DEEC|nr:LysM peptidoglycan-binding domain-containing protein [Streptomyces sp. MA15]MDN3271519.1 LysM peptidoglycan-binding domain-containing protein [Streptomyces sp. MA15]
MRTTHASATAGRTLARVLKAVLSLLVLAGAIAGLPLLLAWATPIIWDASHDDLTHLLDRQDTGSAFLMLLLVVGWIGWIQFTFCAVRELIAQVRGRTWHAPRGLGASQRAAAALIGSILVLLPTSSALASEAQAVPSVSAAHVPGQAQAPTAPEADRPSAASASRMYTVRDVRPAESLWSIAERELGDGERWREIAALNEGRTMPNGQMFQSSSFLQPGWQLQMPEATVGGGFHVQLAGQASAASDESERVVSVHEGDYLSKIAQEELGDAGQWQELFDASKGKPQPDGLPAITDPDVIYAGQQITVPKAQTPDEERHTPPADSHDSAPSDEADGRPSTPADTPAPEDEQQPDDRAEEEAQPPAPGQSATPTPETSAAAPSQQPSRDAGTSGVTPDQNSSASPSATPSAPAEPSSSAGSSPAPAASEPSAPAPVGSPLNLRRVLGAGALLAAAVTGALALRRTLQRRRRRPGEKIAIAPQTSTAEAKLAAAAEPEGAIRLDLALRALAHQVAQGEDDAELPQLRAARIGARTLQVLPADLTQSPPAPFVTGENGWWTLPADADLLAEQDAREVPAPYPALVTIGSTENGDLVVLNLAQLPALLLDGNPVHITEVCTSLALELGMSPWAAEAEIVVIGFGEDLPQLLPTTRIAHMRQPEHALRDLSERLLEAHQMPETRHQPYLLLCTATLDADTAWQFAEVIDKAGTVPVTLVAPASTAAVHFPQAELLNASLNTPQHLDYAGCDVTVQRLEHAAYQQITTALKVSGQPAHPAGGAWREVPDEPETRRPEPPAAKGSAAPEEKPAVTSEPAPAASPQATKVREEVFPALLAASTDPAGLRLLPTAEGPSPDKPSSDQGDRSGQDPAPAAVPAAAAAAAAAKPDNEHSGKESKALDVDTGAAHDLHAPEIRILGPVEVTGVDSSGHGPRMAQLATLLYFRPGRHADVLCEAMDPISPWSTSTLNARLQGLRRCLGNGPDGRPYVPRRSTGDDPYRLSPAVRCDWTHFLHLVERALPQGLAGLTDLEKALTLVRGRPFGGKPLPWAEPLAQEMTTRIIDVAHTVATYRTPVGPNQDLDAARRAVATGLEADDAAELIYRDWLRLEAAAGNRSGLHTAISRIQQINRALDCSPEPETEQLINDLLNGPSTAERNAL